MAFIQYQLYFWNPPTLSAEQEIQIGREIAMQGRDVFLKKAPYLPGNQRQLVEQAPPIKPRGIAILIVFCGAMLWFFAVFWWLLIGLVPILLLSIGSLLHSRSRYRKWVDEMIGKYAAHEATTKRGAN
jgi:hypothetical protein